MSSLLLFIYPMMYNLVSIHCLHKHTLSMPSTCCTHIYTLFVMYLSHSLYTLLPATQFPHIVSIHTCHPHIIYMSSALLLMVSMGLNYLLLWQEFVIEWNLWQECWIVSFQDHVNDLRDNLCCWRWADDVQTMRGRCADDVRTTREWDFVGDFRWWMTYIIRTSSARHPHVIRRQVCHLHVVRTRTRHPHIICQSSAPLLMVSVGLNYLLL